MCGGCGFTDADFTMSMISVEVPAHSNSFVLPQFFSVIDDDINENDQYFAIVAEIGLDVPTNTCCFQKYWGDSYCYGRRGATKIRIPGNDRMLIFMSHDL